MSRSSQVSVAWAGIAGALALVGCKAAVSMNVEAPRVSGELRGRTEVSTRGSSGTAKARIVRVGDKLSYENGEIEFATGSAELVGDSTEDVLDRLGEVLQAYPTLLVRIEGHTDSRGSRESNQKLSEERARAIKTALIRRGVSGGRMSTSGLGEETPERVEPGYCRNRSEETVPRNKLPECQAIWTANRRAGFIVTEGAESLPPAGSEVTQAAAPAPEPAPKPGPRDRSLDWALRLFGGYSLATPGPTLHGGHFGIGVHASQRFGARRRGYVGGGPRLHYRGLGGEASSEFETVERVVHQFGPEGNLLIGGGSEKLVGLFSLRLGLGLSALKTVETTPATLTMPEATSRTDALNLGGWLLGGVVVLGKIAPRWSLGGHVEAGITRVVAPATFVMEVGLNVAWHFGRGRREGI